VRAAALGVGEEETAEEERQGDEGERGHPDRRWHERPSRRHTAVNGGAGGRDVCGPHGVGYRAAAQLGRWLIPHRALGGRQRLARRVENLPWSVVGAPWWGDRASAAAQAG
jgi:hypothetical protein